MLYVLNVVLILYTLCGSVALLVQVVVRVLYIEAKSNKFSHLESEQVIEVVGTALTAMVTAAVPPADDARSTYGSRLDTSADDRQLPNRTGRMTV